MTELERRLTKIKKVLDVSYLKEQDQDSMQIRSYYQTNRIAYRIFHNWEGYLHMGITRGEKYRKEDLLVPLLEIESEIKSSNAKSVVELASGRGANSYFLAKRNPQCNFRLLDLSTSPISKYTQLPNISFNLGDFHDLSQISDASVDIVFILEALCHSDNKLRVLDEVKRILRKGGLFIIYDGYLADATGKLTDVEKEACVLTEKGMAVNHFEALNDFESYVKESGLIISDKENLSSFVLPTMKRFERLARLFFKFPLLSRLAKKVLPEKFVRNSLSGYLMPELIRGEIALYYKHVLVKK